MWGKQPPSLLFFLFFAPPAASLSPRIKEMGEGGNENFFLLFWGEKGKRRKLPSQFTKFKKKRGEKRGWKKGASICTLVSGTAAAGYGKKLLRRGEGDQEKRRRYMGKGPFHTFLFLRIIWILMWNMYGKKGWTSRLRCEVHKKFFFSLLHTPKPNRQKILCYVDEGSHV